MHPTKVVLTCTPTGWKYEVFEGDGVLLSSREMEFTERGAKGTKKGGVEDDLTDDNCLELVDEIEGNDPYGIAKALRDME